MDEMVSGVVGAKGFPLRGRIEPAGARDTLTTRLIQEHKVRGLTKLRALRHVLSIILYPQNKTRSNPSPISYFAEAKTCAPLSYLPGPNTRAKEACFPRTPLSA